MRKFKAPSSQEAPNSPLAPPSYAGFWAKDGSWIATGDENDYWQAPAGSTTRFTRHLAWQRREFDLSPASAARLIDAHGHHAAFPCAPAWLELADWQLAPTRTSAEQAVKSAVARNPTHSDPDPEYARFRFSLLERIFTENMTPQQVAEEIQAKIDQFPNRKLHVEAAALLISRAWGQSPSLPEGHHDQPGSTIAPSPDHGVTHDQDRSA